MVASRGGQFNILWVGSEPKLFAQAQDYLNQLDHQVHLALTQEEGAHLLSQHNIDVAFCILSTEDDLNFLIQAGSTAPHMPVVVLVKQEQMELVLPALRQGAYDYLTLPLESPSTLLEVAQTATSKEPTEQELQNECEMALEELYYHRKSLAQDPKMASLFQASLLPNQQIESGALEVVWRMPLKPEANRYFLDVIPLSEQYTSLYVADFGEESTEAAFSSGVLKVAFGEASRKVQHEGGLCDPKEVMSLAGSCLESMELEQIPGLFYAVLDMHKGKMTWVSAGFEKGPYIWLESATQLIADSGPALTQKNFSQLESYEFNVEPSMPLVFSHLPEDEVLKLAESQSYQQLPLAEHDLLSQPSTQQKGSADVFSLVVRRRDESS